jgi:hypothetical protein
MPLPSLLLPEQGLQLQPAPPTPVLLLCARRHGCITCHTCLIIKPKAQGPSLHQQASLTVSEAGVSKVTPGDPQVLVNRDH